VHSSSTSVRASPTHLHLNEAEDRAASSKSRMRLLRNVRITAPLFGFTLQPFTLPSRPSLPSRPYPTQLRLVSAPSCLLPPVSRLFHLLPRVPYKLHIRRWVRAVVAHHQLSGPARVTSSRLWRVLARTPLDSLLLRVDSSSAVLLWEIGSSYEHLSISNQLTNLLGLFTLFL
jgi:hypothetical protein